MDNQSTVTEEKHFTATEENRKGYFEKSNAQIPDYRKACLDGKRGFLGPLHNAHHILPATAFKRSLKERTAEQQAYAKNCQHVTPWNINNDKNLIGLPHLRAFIVCAGITRAEPDEYIKARSKSLLSSTAAPELEAMRTELRRAPPERYPVHLPVSWGHTLYNHAVMRDLKTQVWDTLDEKKPEHKVNPQSIAELLHDLEKKYYNLLKNRGVGATLNNWRLRSDPSVKSWYKSFTMYSGANPLG